MTSRREDTANYIGTTLFVVLFVLFVSLFSNKTFNQTSYSPQYIFKSELHVSQQKAVIAEAIPLTTVQKSCLAILYNANINLFSETDKILADNSKTTQQFGLLQKVQLQIKPILLCRFCVYLFPTDDEDLPILS